MSGQVAEQQLKGNYGEHLASLVLSRSCLVRPTVGQTDVGVDLYCESIIESVPFLHFWVQVKASENVPNEDAEASWNFDVTALRYWARQPVPVLGFLVPVRWPPEVIHYIHVVDLTLDILTDGIRFEQRTQRLHSNRALIIPVSDIAGQDAKLRIILLDHLPMVVSAMYAEKGFVYPAPKPQDEYTQHFSGHILARRIPRIEQRLQHAAIFGMRWWLDEGNDINTAPRGLLAVLQALEDNASPECQETLGRVCQARGNAAGARTHYQTAIHAIENDPARNPTVPPWSEAIMRLNERIQSLPE
jgi:hypothetical protein